MKFETVGIHFLSDVFGLLSSGILLPWQCDVATSPSIRDPFKGTPLIFFLFLKYDCQLTGCLNGGSCIFRKFQKPFAAFAKDHGLANIVKVFTQLCVQLASIRMSAII